MRSYTSIILIGYFKTPFLAGLYNAASPLAEFMLVTSTAMSLIYVPITSGLYAKGLMDKFRRDYTVLVKWISAVSLPLFLVLVLFPGTVLGFVFGAEYASAAGALRILSLGFFVANLLSLANFGLISIGRPRLLMWALLIAVVVGIMLGIVLIPPFGLVGAAIASAISVVVAEVICSVWLYSLTKAQPFSKNLLKPFTASLLAVAVVYFAATSLFNVAFWMLPVFFAVFCLIYVLAVIFTKSFDREDIIMLLTMEKKAGINATPVKRFLGRFVKLEGS
jgi:O-antigen/teichoic acid export membrane protein